MNKDYKDFTNSANSPAPKELSTTVLNYISNDLNPEKKVVFAKLVAIQAFIGLITMTFCPQYALSLTASYDLFHYFHHTFGEFICMVICGSIFMGSAAIFACSILKGAELKQIRETRGLYFMALSIISLGAFIVAGADVYSSITFFWLIGTIGSGFIIFELNGILRKSLKLG